MLQSLVWQARDGKNIEGILITLQNYIVNRKYPLYVAVHGGPSGAWWRRYLGGCDEYSNIIDPLSCWRNKLDLGFVIFEPNPRGSHSYGIDFNLTNFEDFSGGDYADIIASVDYLIHQGIADLNHLAIGG